MKNLTLFFILLFTATSASNAQRVTDGLVDLFTFGEQQGEFVHDVSGSGFPTLLTIHNTNAVTWLEEGGLRIDAPVLIHSSLPAQDFYSAAMASEALTLEAWVSPDNTVQDGPARILTISEGTSTRNTMLAQDGGQYVARLRTTETDNNGMPNIGAGAGSVSTNLQHVVFTRDASGATAFYIDGELVSTGERTGALSNWNSGYSLTLANESGADRPWTGTYHLVALYGKALSAAEVEQNYAAGSSFPSPDISDALCEEQVCWVDGFGIDRRALWLPNLPDGVDHRFMFDEEGGGFDVFDDGRVHIYGHCINMFTPGYGFYVDFWFKDKKSWEEWSALGRGWKGDPNIVGDLYETWDYYIMDDEEENVLIGTGLFEGSLLHVTHRPSDYYYGLQIGMAANDQNAEPGMSCWFDYTGQINGEAVAHHGDINLEGSCNDIHVVQCPIDLEVSCEDGVYTPEIAGEPVIFCNEEYTLTYEDEILSEECPIIVHRTWTATSANGNVAQCDQTITVVDDEAPVIGDLPLVISDCDVETVVNDYVNDNCTDQVSISYETSDPVPVNGDDCDPGQLRTQTIGGWGTTPSGNNPGTYLAANFAAAFPNGLTIGCDNTLTLTSPEAIQEFLPSGTSPTALPDGDMLDPGGAYNNVFAAQLVGLTLSVGFDNYDPDFGASEFALEQGVLASGPFAGWTVEQLLTEANAAIGGCESAFSFSEISGALTGVNENYVDGTQDNGFIDCGLPFDCALELGVVITATDACGNTATSEQVVYIIDESAPVITEFPENLTVECGEAPEPVIAFDDGCSTPFVEVTVEEDYFSGPCAPALERTFILTDPCGNTTTHTQIITFTDTTPPQILNEPSDLVLPCGAEIPDFVPEYTDNCGDAIVDFDEQSEPIECGFLITRSWSVTDACGNSATIDQQILLQDNEGPQPLEVPVDITVNCENIPPISEVAFVDACSTVLGVNTSEEQVGEGCDYVLVRTWEATDACGNVTIVEQTINVIDDEAPEFVSVPQDMVLECGAEAPDANPVVMDNCSSVELSLEETIEANGADCQTITRVWTATDACGNTSTATQTVVFEDTEAPIFLNAPAAEASGCEALYEVPEVSAVDNCDGNVEVSYDEDLQTADCVLTLTRTWTAMDECGNVSTAQQVVTATDEQAPAITGQSEVSIECTQFTADFLINVTDDCAFGLEISFEDELIAGQSNACERTILRVWFAQDACGNVATFEQTIHLTDETAPVFADTATEFILSCNDEADSSEPEVSDACGEVFLSLDSEYIDSECGPQLIKTWTATDDCGNSSTLQQTFTFVDEEAPTFGAIPADLVVQCTDPVPAAESVVAFDNCSTPDISFDEELIPGFCPESYTLVRTWTATDACGNTASVSQTIEVRDDEAPVFDFLPEDITADCGTVPEPPAMTATDNCSAVTITYEENVAAGGCPNIFRTWTATDACGNSASYTQNVFIQDVEPPLLTGIPDNTTATCNSIPDMPEPEVSDNCDEDVAVTFNESIVGSGCEFTIIRTWIASDDCGNNTIVSQSITVQDTDAPVFMDFPAEMTVECSNLDAIPLPDVTDDCSNVVTVTFEDQPQGEGCEYDIIRTYTATDQCGHQSSFDVTIHVFDATAPVISGVGPNNFADCSSVPAPDNAVATDACGNGVNVEVVETIIEQEGCDYIINRTYIATDDCGNGTALTQLIYVSDMQQPVLIGVPENITVDCDEDIPGAPNVGVNDNCSEGLTVNFFEFTETNGCEEIVTRTWSATDDCGNTVTATRTVTRTDLSAPVIADVPADTTVSCEAIPAVTMPTATDNCSANVALTVEDVVLDGACPYEIHRTFIAIDDCGNQSIAVQVITVVDEIAPVLTNLPENVTVNCDALPPVAEVTAFDNCSDVTILFEENWGTPGCVQMVTRTWTAVDGCGNSDSYTQNITLTDDAAPQFMSTPENLTVSCLDVPAFAMLEVYDGCGVVDTSMDEYVIETDCVTEYTLVRIWSATDACGNTTTVSQEIEVIDDVAPILINVPADTTVDCNTIPEIPEVSALESCGEIVEVTFEEFIETTEDSTAACTASNAEGIIEDIAFWLPGVDGVNDTYVFGPEGGSFVEDPATGTAVLSGQVYNVDNAAMSWYFELHLKNARTWEEWSALGRSYKDDLGIGEPYYESWTYYEMDEELTTVVGMDQFAGSELTLSHAPATYYYGYQVGMNANNRSEGYGLGGWFTYTGQIDEVAVEGHGDFFAELYCCPDQTIYRTWTAVDCAGNTVSATQVINVTDLSLSDPFMLVYDDPQGLQFDVSGSEGEQFTITFEADYSGQARIELFNMSGGCVDIVREWEVIKGAKYRFTYPKDNLPPGTYVFTVSGDNRVGCDTEMVLR
jgi:hypothetical protein